MNQVLEISKESAQKMTSHADADAKYDAFKKRWVVIDATAKDWIGKYEKMVDVWAKQAETAAKVTAAICEYFLKGKGFYVKLNVLFVPHIFSRTQGR